MSSSLEDDKTTRAKTPFWIWNATSSFMTQWAWGRAWPTLPHLDDNKEWDFCATGLPGSATHNFIQPFLLPSREVLAPEPHYRLPLVPRAWHTLAVCIELGFGD